MATTMTTQPARIQSTITSSDGNPRLNPTSSSSSDSASLSVSAKALCAKLRPPSMRLGWTRTVVNHVKKHMGVGIVCAVAYFDPYVSFSPLSSMLEELTGMLGVSEEETGAWIYRRDHSLDTSCCLSFCWQVVWQCISK